MAIKEDASNNRKHIRSRIRAEIKITNPSNGEVLVYTRDLSDGGLFALSEGKSLPKVGETVQVQVQMDHDDAPILEAEVMRSNENGIGLMFKFGTD